MFGTLLMDLESGDFQTKRQAIERGYPFFIAGNEWYLFIGAS